MVREARVASEDTDASVRLLIFDGDPVVGRALELLLRTAGYDAVYLARDRSARPEAIGGAQLLLLAPGWDGESRRDAAVLAGAPGAENLPVLEMGAPPEGVPVRSDRYVPWPCRTEELKRRIAAALAARPEQDAVAGDRKRRHDQNLRRGR